MIKRCVYCNSEIADDRCVDICDTCGVGTWGPNGFKAIKQNTADAKERGDLFQGSVIDGL